MLQGFLIMCLLAFPNYGLTLGLVKIPLIVSMGFFLFLSPPTLILHVLDLVAKGVESLGCEFALALGDTLYISIGIVQRLIRQLSVDSGYLRGALVAGRTLLWT